MSGSTSCEQVDCGGSGQCWRRAVAVPLLTAHGRCLALPLRLQCQVPGCAGWVASADPHVCKCGAVQKGYVRVGSAIVPCTQAACRECAAGPSVCSACAVGWSLLPGSSTCTQLECTAPGCAACQPAGTGRQTCLSCLPGHRYNTFTLACDRCLVPVSTGRGGGVGVGPGSLVLHAWLTWASNTLLPTPSPQQSCGKCDASLDVFDACVDEFWLDSGACTQRCRPGWWYWPADAGYHPSLCLPCGDFSGGMLVPGPSTEQCTAYTVSPSGDTCACEVCREYMPPTCAPLLV